MRITGIGFSPSCLLNAMMYNRTCIQLKRVRLDAPGLEVTGFVHG